MLRFSNVPSRRGQSLIEVLIASAVGTVLLLGTLTIIVPALRGNSQAQHAQAAAGLARQLAESVRVWGEASWQNVYALNKGSSTPYFLITNTAPFVSIPGTESIALDGAPGLLGHWKLDESVTGTAYNFASSTGNGTAQGSPAATSSCRIGSCWSFNGTNQSVRLSGNPTAFQLGTGTVSAWIKTSNAGSGLRGIVTKQNAYGMLLNGNVFGIYDWGNAVWRDSQISLNDNQWHHVACTFQDNVVNGTLCYVDGVLRYTTTMKVGNQTVNVMIGETNGSQYFGGLIDDARIYTRVLSAAEVQRLYNAPVYTRYFFMENVGRSAGVIQASGGTDDPSTQRLTVAYSWPQVATRTLVSYLTRSRTNVVWQTDWSGGGGQDGPTTTVNSLFATSTNIDFSTTTGSIRINGI